MNHFIYSMVAADKAPAAGGDTKSWFYYYKWDVDDRAYVPAPEGALDVDEPPAGMTLWFVMDTKLIGYVPVLKVLPAFSGGIELHYDTREIQVVPEAGAPEITLATGPAFEWEKMLDKLKAELDKTCPPRNQTLPQSTT